MILVGGLCVHALYSFSGNQIRVLGQESSSTLTISYADGSRYNTVRTSKPCRCRASAMMRGGIEVDVHCFFRIFSPYISQTYC